MGQVDTFREYVKRRLEEWGDEYSLSRDFENLGHQSKNMLQILIEHKGEMPGRVTGYKPLEVLATAQTIEDIVADIARDQMPIACTLRAYYCGKGRKKVERFETANNLMAAMSCRRVSLSQFRNLHELGFAMVRGALIGMARAA
jgi:hypothetical protein